MKRYRIAVVPGDGIGQEIVPAGLKVLEAAASRNGFALDTETFPWGAGYYIERGEFMPEDGLDRLRAFDAIYFGAVGRWGSTVNQPGAYYNTLQEQATKEIPGMVPGVKSTVSGGGGYTATLFYPGQPGTPFASRIFARPSAGHSAAVIDSK